jgi:hypothetical protein
MNILSESLTIGLLLALVFGALFFYLYSRVSYAEKRVGLIENILIDIKMNQEQQPVHILPSIPPSMNFDNASFMQSIEISPPPHVEEVTTVVENNTVEELYSDVLNEAHESLDLSENHVVAESNEVISTVSVNYESMTKEELIEVAKQKGIRVSNRPGREKLIQLIRGNEVGIAELKLGVAELKRHNELMAIPE